MRRLYSYLFALLFFYTFDANAQCISSVQVGSYTANGSSFAQQQIFSCNFAGDYAIVNIPAGIWTFSTSVSTDYITITNTSNSVLATGTGSVQYATTSAITVRMHIFENSACDEDFNCRNSYVQQDEIPIPQIASSDTFLCFGAGPVTLTASNTFGSQTYWYEGSCNSTPIDSGSTTVVNLSTTTTYYANNLFNGGLGSCDSFTVTVTTNPVLSFSNVTDVLCHGDSTGEIFTSVSGGTSPFAYAWSNGDTSANLMGLDTGTYQVIVTDSVGCDDTNSVTISQPTPLTSTIVSTSDPLCFGSATGTATVSASGGVSPYNYVWTNGDNGTMADSLTAGEHIVNIIDSNGCILKDTAELTNPPAINLGVTKSVNVDCFGGSSGVIEVGAFGGTGALTFVWSNGATTTEISNLSAGVYTVTVTDANGCEESVSDTITEPADLTTSFDVTDATCDDTEDASITVLNSGGSAPYSYTWSNGATGSQLVNLAVGEYEVTITDDSGCVYVETTIVDYINEDPEIALDSTMKLCEGFEITLDAGNEGSTFVWSTGDSTQSIQVDSAGVYAVSVTDANGCMGDAEVVVVEEECVGIPEPAWVSGVNVYPNPSTGIVNVEFPDQKGSWELHILDLQGRSVYRSVARSTFETLDIRSVAKGVYLLRIEHSGMHVTRRLIIE